MKSDGVNRSNIFGITKDNHLNAVFLALRSVAFRWSRSIDPFTCVLKVLFSCLCHLSFVFEDLQWHPVCAAAMEGGGRMYPIFINLRAESGLRASVCAHMPEVQTNYFVIRVGAGGFIARPLSTLRPPPPRLFVRLLACGCTQYLTDLWSMNYVREWLSSHGT